MGATLQSTSTHIQETKKKKKKEEKEKKEKMPT